MNNQKNVREILLDNNEKMKDQDDMLGESVNDVN